MGENIKAPLPVTTFTPWIEDTSAPGYGEPDPGNPHTSGDDDGDNSPMTGGAN